MALGHGQPRQAPGCTQVRSVLGDHLPHPQVLEPDRASLLGGIVRIQVVDNNDVVVGDGRPQTNGLLHGHQLRTSVSSRSSIHQAAQACRIRSP